MKLVACAVFDRSIQAFARPMFVPHINSATRAFTDEINNSSAQSELFKHPDDYDLFELGEFDDSDGSFALHKAPKLILVGKHVHFPPSSKVA